MRPLRDIKRLMRHAPIDATPEGDRAVLDDLLRQLPGRRDTVVPVGWRIWRTVARVTAVAAMIAIVALVVISRTSHKPSNSVTLSAADMLTVGHLNAACRRGGPAEVDRQCERAARSLQSRPERISLEQLIEEMKGT